PGRRARDRRAGRRGTDPLAGGRAPEHREGSAHSGIAGSSNPCCLCDPSQNGLLRDCPHRHRVWRLRTSYGVSSSETTGIPPRIQYEASGSTPTDGSNVGSRGSGSGSTAKASRPDGHRCTIAVNSLRTSGSSASSTISQTPVRTLRQNPAWVQSDRSSYSTWFASPSQASRRLAIGPRSAVSGPSNGIRSWVESQKGLVDDRPQRQSS